VVSSFNSPTVRWKELEERDYVEIGVCAGLQQCRPTQTVPEDETLLGSGSARRAVPWPYVVTG